MMDSDKKRNRGMTVNPLRHRNIHAAAAAADASEAPSPALSLAAANGPMHLTLSRTLPSTHARGHTHTRTYAAAHAQTHLNARTWCNSGRWTTHLLIAATFKKCV